MVIVAQMNFRRYQKPGAFLYEKCSMIEDPHQVIPGNSMIQDLYIHHIRDEKDIVPFQKEQPCGLLWLFEWIKQGRQDRRQQ